MRHVLLFDEVNKLEDFLRSLKSSDSEKKKLSADELVDTVLELLIMAYVFGTDDANEMLGIETEVNTDEMQEAIYKKIADKDFAERLREYADTNDVEAIIKVANTESHRVYNTASYQTALEGGATMKRWVATIDDRTRDTHFYLDGTTIPLDAEFYTYKGNKAMFPGQFGVAEEDCNCRCVVEYTK